MGPEQENTGNMQSIQIDGALYEQLRAYCDENGIRFVDFIEEALENATHLDQIMEVLGDAHRVKERIEETQRISVRYGFKRGVMTALLAMEGKLGLSLATIPSAVKEKPPIKSVQGRQLKLFS